MTSPSAVLNIATTVGAVGAGILLSLLIAACITDLRERRIPNKLVLALIVGGLLFNAFTTSSVAAVGRAGMAGLFGLAIWLPLYAFRMLGAGDVKFFAAACFWLTPAQVGHAALYTALAGGALSVFWLLVEYGPAYGLARAVFVSRAPIAAVRSRVGGPARRHVPYGIAMAVGVALAVWLPRS
jgi:prepilin peptidase CpaA